MNNTGISSLTLRNEPRGSNCKSWATVKMRKNHKLWILDFYVNITLSFGIWISECVNNHANLIDTFLYHATKLIIQGLHLCISSKRIMAYIIYVLCLGHKVFVVKIGTSDTIYFKTCENMPIEWTSLRENSITRYVWPPGLWIVSLMVVYDNYNTRSTQKSPVRQQNAWFDTKKPGSTQKCPVRHKNALPSMHQLTLPLSNITPPPAVIFFFSILFQYFFLRTNREMKMKLYILIWIQN